MSRKKSDRSSPYPSFTIEYCLDVAQRVYSNYPNYFATRENIAELFGVSADNMIMKVSSCVQYGLLERKVNEGYKATELFLTIHKALNEKESQDALLDCFRSPKLYQNLMAGFENKAIPSEKALSNILVRFHSISEKASSKAAKVFLENANFIQIIDSDGAFTPGLEESEDVIPEVEEKEAQNVEHNVPIIVAKSESGEAGTENVVAGDGYFTPFPIPLSIKKKRFAQLIIPNDIEKDEFEKITDWIRRLKDNYE